jgi:hypothetical protein
MKNIYQLVFITFLLTSCEGKRLDLKTFSSGDIKVNWYRVSTITTIHDYVDIKRRGYEKNVMKANTGGIYSISIKGDTITIQTTRELLVYELVAKTLGCTIKQDTSISTFEYFKKYMP